MSDGGLQLPLRMRRFELSVLDGRIGCGVRSGVGVRGFRGRVSGALLGRPSGVVGGCGLDCGSGRVVHYEAAK